MINPTGMGLNYFIVYTQVLKENLVCVAYDLIPKVFSQVFSVQIRPLRSPEAAVINTKVGHSKSKPKVTFLPFPLSLPTTQVKSLGYVIRLCVRRI